MNLTDTETLKFQKGSPVFIQDICAVYTATLGEIVDLGYDKFQEYLSIITTTKPSVTNDNELSMMLKDLSDFEYILVMVHLDRQANQTLKEAFQFFIHEHVTFSLDPAQIIVGPLDEKHILDEEKFYDLQRIIRRAYFLQTEKDEIVINKNDDPRVKAMKMQMRENREKVRRAKAKQAERENTNLQLSDLIGSLTINHCNLNAVNIYDISYYMFHDQLKRMGWRDEFDINNRAAMAGAKLKKSQLKHWMRSISN